MVANFKNLDMFGVQFTLYTFGQQKFKTNFGATMTAISLTIIGVFIYLFGTDFWYHENPNVIPNQIVHIQSKKIPLNNEKYTFMFRLKDDNIVKMPEDKIPYKLGGSYGHLRKNKDGVLEMLCWVGGSDIIKKCSETKATLNPDLTKEKLDIWFCWNEEAIKTKCRAKLKDKEPNYEPFLGGGLDEDEYAGLRYDVLNYERDWETFLPSSIVPDEKFSKVGVFSIHTRYPAVSYDGSSAGNPITTYYELTTKAVNPNTYTRHMNFMSLVTNIDDTGWVFPNRTTTQSMELDKSESESVAQPGTVNGSRVFYLGFFFNVKKEKVYKRTFMKLQQLSALVGGMTKSVFMVFAFYAMFKSIQARDKELRKRFYEVKCIKTSGDSEFPLQQQEMKVNTLVKSSESNQENVTKLGWCAYLLRCCSKSETEVTNARIFKQMNKHMYEKLDVAYLVKQFEEFSLLKELLCSEEQKEQLENHKTEVQVEA